MASEIRANKQTNRVGLGTVTYTDTGIIVSGIVTANSFKGDGSSLTGIDATALKDTGGAVKIQAQASGAIHSGISTFNEIKLSGTKKIILGNNGDLELSGGGNSLIANNTGALSIINYENNNDIKLLSDNGSGGVTNYIILDGSSGEVLLHHYGNEKIKTTNTGVTVTGTVSATAFTGDGSSLSNLPAGAPVGGASTNTVFFENDKAVAVNYQITSTKNAMSAGPISINAGIAVTVPSGCSWTIV